MQTLMVGTSVRLAPLWRSGRTEECERCISPLGGGQELGGEGRHTTLQSGF